MATWIEVTAFDVNGNRVNLKSAKIAIDGGLLLHSLQPNPSGTGFEGDITGASTIQLRVQADGFWDVKQHLELHDGEPPVVEPLSSEATYNPYDYEINLDPPIIHTRGATDWGITITVRLSHLRDAETKVRQVLKNSHDVGWAQEWDTEMDFDLVRVCSTRLVQKYALGPEGAQGAERLNMTLEAGAPGGSLYFLERLTNPKLILVWQPKGITIGEWYEDNPVPLHYHMFFHPSIPWSDHPPGEEAYPWNFDSLNLPHRYLMGRPPHPPADPNPDQLDLLKQVMKRHKGEEPKLEPRNKNKHMLHQIAASQAGVHFVYPVGSAAHWMGDLTKQAGALLLLQEINHFVQRRNAAEVAIQPIGRIGVSGFSFGYRGPVELANGPPVAEFDDQWDEIYNFDGNEAWFVEPTRKWLGKRPDKRRVRIYSHSDQWSTLVKGDTWKRFSATETESAQGSVLFLPTTFWQGAFGTSNFDLIHQVFPALFLHHAMLRWFLI